MAALTTSFMEWRDLVKYLKPGDLVEFDREILAGSIRYKHWGVYWGVKNGEHYLIHYTKYDNATVGMETLEAAADDTKCRKNNECDKEWDPLPVNEVLARAQEMLDTQNYNLLKSNCEHFSHYCRYGKASSYQVDRAAAMWFSPLAAVLGDKETVRTVSKVAKGYYSYLTFSPALAAYRINLRIMRTFFMLIFILATAAAALMPGSTDSFIANGKGGLGRWQRHMDQTSGRSSYYGNGFNYGYAPAYQPFGFFG